MGFTCFVKGANMQFTQMTSKQFPSNGTGFLIVAPGGHGM
jgi:hypothetical protein